MSVESDRTKQQFESAKKNTAELVHRHVIDAALAENKKILIDQPGFVFTHLDKQPIDITQTNSLDQMKP